jgi:uncharacterized membrane protein SpoIIM required for sporulation
MVALTAICSVPLFYSIIVFEADKDDTPQTEYGLMKEHSKAISAFTFLFVGFVTAFLIWFIVLPNTTVQEVFNVQLNTISQVMSSTTPTGNAIFTVGTVGLILMNNLKILLFCFILSFFFGAGAIFILTWNASVVATAIGMFAKNSILSYISPGFALYSQAVSMGFLKYMTHGVIEIIAYFVGALAGGIISTAVIKHNYRTPEFRKTLLDSLDIMTVSIIILFVAAVVEVFVTPYIV